MDPDGVVTCGTCRQWTADTINPAHGAGTCALGDQHKRTKSPLGGAGHLPYPNAPRWCDRHQPKRN